MASKYLSPLSAFLVFFALALSWSLGTPLLSAADEPEIVVKAAATVRGEFSGPQSVFAFPGWQQRYGTPDFLEVTYHIPRSLVSVLEKDDPKCYAFFIDVPPSCTLWANADKAAHPGTTATSHMDYFPLYYILVGWPSLIIGGSHAIYAMRVVSGFITACLLAAAFAVSRRRHGAGAVGVVAAVTPAAIYWGAVVNPSGLEIASALLAWVSLLSLVRSAPGAPGVRGDRIMFAVSAAALILVRPLGPLWLAAIVVSVLTTVRLADLRAMTRRVRHAPGIRWMTGLLVLAVLAAGLWDLTQNTMGIIPEQNPLYTYQAGVYVTLFQMPDDLAQMLGTVGWNDVPVPTFTSILWYGAIAALVLMALVFGDRRERLTLLGLTAAVVLFPIAFEAYSGTNYGTGWQGRYGLPLAVGVPILSAEILTRRLFAGGWGKAPRTLATTLGAAVGLAYLCQVWWAWRRYGQGLFGVGKGHVIPRPALWTPVIGWPLTLALALAGVAGLFLLLRGSAATPPVEAPEDGEGLVLAEASAAASAS